MGEEGLMGVGELARRVGVTVRTIQFYDQKGLLSPTSLGASRQRLYSAEDEAKLHRILTLKRLGLTLSEIRVASVESDDGLRRVAERSREALDAEWLKLIKGLSALRIIEGELAAPDQIDWHRISQAIAQADAGVDERWEAGFCTEGGPGAFPREELMAWHVLMGDAIAALNEGEAPAGVRARDLARRYLSLGGAERAAAGLEQMERAFEASGRARGSTTDYRVLQDRVMGFLQEAVDATFPG